MNNRGKANLLSVDTSSRALSVAVRARGNPPVEINVQGVLRHSERLVDAIREGLAAVKLKKEEVDYFLWGLGPGSFTGLRIGLSVLKGLSLGLSKKAFGVSSLDLIALGAGLSSGRLIACVDARRGRLYGAVYHIEKGDVTRAHTDCLWSLDDLLHEIENGTLITGDGLETYGDMIRKHAGRSAAFLDSAFWYPKAGAAIRVWNEKRDWLKPLSLRTMIPTYLRLSEAEDKLSLQTKAL